MELIEEKRGPALILRPRGRMDTGAAEEFEARLAAAINGGEAQLLIDLSRLDYVCSSGLRALLHAAKRLTGANGRLVMHSPSAPVRQVFEITGFGMVFRIFDSEEAAVAGLAGTGLLPSCLLRDHR